LQLSASYLLFSISLIKITLYIFVYLSYLSFYNNYTSIKRFCQAFLRYFSKKLFYFFYFLV
jgi:hypothetical protein